MQKMHFLYVIKETNSIHVINSTQDEKVCTQKQDLGYSCLHNSHFIVIMVIILHFRRTILEYFVHDHFTSPY